MRIKKFFLIVIIILVLIFAGIIIYNKFSISFPMVPVKLSNTITYIPSYENTNSILMDFSKCSPGRNTVYHGQGSTYFVFEGIKNESCVFYYSKEVENGGISSFTKCSVPISLGQKTFKNAFGVNLDEIQNYCTKPR